MTIYYPPSGAPVVLREIEDADVKAMKRLRGVSRLELLNAMLRRLATTPFDHLAPESAEMETLLRTVELRMLELMAERRRTIARGAEYLTRGQRGS